MAGRVQLLGLALSICVLLLGGCNQGVASNGGEPLSTTEQRAQLLAKLERRFDDPATHVKVGRLFQAEGRFDDAKYHFERAHSFDPVYWPAQAAIVRLLQERGKTSEAEVAAELLMTKVARSAERSLDLGDAFEEAKEDKFALRCYEQALHLDRRSARAHKKLGFYYLNRGDKVRAKEHLKQSYNLDWNQPDVAHHLGWLRVPIVLEPQRGSKGKTSGAGGG